LIVKIWNLGFISITKYYIAKLNLFYRFS